MTLYYQFPAIHNLSDVLPAINGSPEFTVTEKDGGYTCVRYQMMDSDTFPSIQGDDAMYPANVRSTRTQSSRCATGSRRLGLTRVLIFVSRIGMLFAMGN